MTTHIIDTAPTLLNILANSNGDSSTYILAIPFIVMAAVYYGIYKFYRNAHRRYDYERRTNVKVDGMESEDTFLRKRKNLKNKKIKGDNSLGDSKSIENATPSFLNIANDFLN